MVFSIAAVSVCIPTNSAKEFPILHSSPAFTDYRFFFFFFDDGHSDWCEVMPHFSCDLHFSNSERY